MECLIYFLDTIYPISSELKQYLFQHLKVHMVLKRQYLLRAGHVCRNIYFIKNGLVRCFYLKGDVEVSSWFMKEGDVIISVESFFGQLNSYESIQALEDCELHGIEYNQLQFLYRTFPEFNFIGRVLTEKYYCKSEQRLYAMRMMRARERYEHLLENHPELILRVPAKYIASYLGITEQHFSAIKAKKLIS